MRIKEQETRLTFHKYDDDDDDITEIMKTISHRQSNTSTYSRKTQRVYDLIIKLEAEYRIKLHVKMQHLILNNFLSFRSFLWDCKSYFNIYFFPPMVQQPLNGPRPIDYRGFMTTPRHTTPDRTPPDE